jgi:hypothetical protein
MRPLLLALPISLILLANKPCSAQTLSSRPAIFTDPSLGNDPSYGELVLGQTTLMSALRIFAVELQDSVYVPLGHGSNPDTVRANSELPGGLKVRPRYRLEIGAGRYTLYFDRHERLVAAITDRSQLPRALRRDELVARYPTLSVAHVGRTAEGAWIMDDLAASLTPCVSLVADVWRRDKGMVGSIGYIYTCATAPSSRKATLDRDP